LALLLSPLWGEPLPAQTPNAPAAAPAVTAPSALTNRFTFRSGERVVLLGDTFLEREQGHGDIEFLLTTHYPDRDVTFRNLGRQGLAAGGAGGVPDPLDTDLERLKAQVAAFRPTVAVVGCGLEAAAAGEAGVARFTTNVQRLLDATQDAAGRTNPLRWIILSPMAREQLPPPAPDPAEQNAKRALYARTLNDLADRRQALFVPVFDLTGGTNQPRSDLPLSEDNLRLTAYGYRRVAECVGWGLGWDPHNWRFGVLKDGNFRQGGYGVDVRDLSRQEDRMRAVMHEEFLVWPPLPTKAGQAQPWLATPACRIQVVGLKPGQYDLKVDGQTVRTLPSGEIGRGLQFAEGPQFAQAEELRQAIVRKNALVFRRWRPGDPAYETIFPKDVLANTPQEAGKLDALVRAEEEKIARLRKPKPRAVELVWVAPPSTNAPTIILQQVPPAAGTNVLPAARP
jgi:lysophospholipase L1-like esterase